MSDLYVLTHKRKRKRPQYFANRLVAAHGICKACPELSKQQYTERLGFIMCELADKKRYQHKGMLIVLEELKH